MGSIISIRTSSGRLVISIETMIEFKQTDLPVPVRPAISKCGMLAMSTTMGLPATSLPRKIGIFIERLFDCVSSITSRRRTICRVVFGTSMPTEFLPGIGATIRTLGTRSAIARSSARLVILASRRPASSSISYCEITGPVSISTTFTLNPNSPKVFSSTFARSRTSCSCWSSWRYSVARSRSSDGSS